MNFLIIFYLILPILNECDTEKPKLPYKRKNLNVPYPYQYNRTSFPSTIEYKKIKLFAFIPVYLCAKEARNVIRNTWLTEWKYYGYDYKFFMGKDYIANNIYDENKRYNDIIQFNFVNNYLNLTILTLLSLQWILKHYVNVEYVMKCDQDMFPNIQRINLLITEFPEYNHPFLSGYVSYKALVSRNKIQRHYLPHGVYKKQRLPSYTYGGFMFYSKKAMEIIINDQISLKPIIYREDVYIGLLANKYHFELIDLRDEYNRTKNNSCILYNKRLCLHGFSYKELLYMWKKCGKDKLSFNNKKSYSKYIYYQIVIFSIILLFIYRIRKCRILIIKNHNSII